MCILKNTVWYQYFAFITCFLMLTSFSQDLSVIYVPVKELTSNISDREPCPGPRRTVCALLWGPFHWGCELIAR